MLNRVSRKETCIGVPLSGRIIVIPGSLSLGFFGLLEQHVAKAGARDFRHSPCYINFFMWWYIRIFSSRLTTKVSQRSCSGYRLHAVRTQVDYRRVFSHRPMPPCCFKKWRKWLTFPSASLAETVGKKDADSGGRNVNVAFGEGLPTNRELPRCAFPSATLKRLRF